MGRQPSSSASGCSLSSCAHSPCICSWRSGSAFWSRQFPKPSMSPTTVPHQTLRVGHPAILSQLRSCVVCYTPSIFEPMRPCWLWTSNLSGTEYWLASPAWASKHVTLYSPICDGKQCRLRDCEACVTHLNALCPVAAVTVGGRLVAAPQGLLPQAGLLKACL
jgi:hypothetical protein